MAGFGSEEFNPDPEKQVELDSQASALERSYFGVTNQFDGPGISTLPMDYMNGLMTYDEVKATLNTFSEFLKLVETDPQGAQVFVLIPTDDIMFVDYTPQIDEAIRIYPRVPGLLIYAGIMQNQEFINKFRAARIFGFIAKNMHSILSTNPEEVKPSSDSKKEA